MNRSTIHRPARNAGRVLFIALATTLAVAGSGTATAQSTCSPAVGEAYLDAGNVRARILNNGSLFYRGSPAVYEVPKGDGAHAVFASNFWLGGFVGEDLRVAAARYGQFEYWTGPLDEDGNPPDDCSAFDKVWEITREEIETYETTEFASANLLSWPTGLGAPTLAPAESDGIDNDDDGDVDEPGEMTSITRTVLAMDLADRIDRIIDLEAGERPDMLGDQMLWWIMNDVGNTHESTGSDPIGVEIHATAFAHESVEGLGGVGPGGDASFYRDNTTFYRYRIWYRGSEPLERAYVGLFADLELGYFADDYLATDTTRALAYVYNADNDDEGSAGYGAAPPALGYTLLEGPTVASVGDTATVAGSRVPDRRDVGLASTMMFVKNDPPVAASEYYNVMQALWYDGEPLREGGTGVNMADPAPPTRFMYPGDPLIGAYWSEVNSDDAGTPNEPYDKRVVMGSGPFEMASGEMQEIAFAIVWARGTDNMDSVVELLAATDSVRQTFSLPVFNVSNAHTPKEPTHLSLTASPNPAAARVDIRYQLEEPAVVQLDVFDIVGRRVRHLLAEPSLAGGRAVSLDVTELPSGVYFVRLESGTAVATKKLIVTR